MNDTITATTAEIRERADPRHVLADRVGQLYDQMPVAIVATFVAGSLATYELWGQWLTQLVIYWWVLVAIFTGAATSLLVAYRRAKNRFETAAQWLRWIGIAALANGVNWGFAGAVFFRSLTDQQQVFLAFLFAGMASIGSNSGFSGSSWTTLPRRRKRFTVTSSESRATTIWPERASPVL